MLAEGPVRLAGHPLLGVGYCGLVIAGIWQGQEVAIKLRCRRSCQQSNLNDEARILWRANLLSIGPQLYSEERIYLPKRINL